MSFNVSWFFFIPFTDYLFSFLLPFHRQSVANNVFLGRVYRDGDDDDEGDGSDDGNNR